MQVSNYPLITIGITAYNAVDTINRAIQSAIGQDYPNIEILIVDDCSSDGTQDYLQKLSSELKPIRIVLRPRNGGCGAARNTLIEHAHGEYIAFFDDDDESFPSRVSSQYERLSTFEKKMDDRSPVFCFIPRIVRKKEDPATDVLVMSAGYKPPEPSGISYLEYIFLNVGDPALSWGQTGIGTCMARTAHFSALGLFNENFRRGEEWDFFVRAAMKGAYFISTPTPQMIQHITHSEDKTGQTVLNFSLKLRKTYKSYLKNNGIYSASVCAAHARYSYANGKRTSSVLWTLAACVLSPKIVLKYHFLRKFCR